MEDWHYRQLYELEDDHWWFRGRRAVIRALLGRAGLPPTPRILDAGCGTGRTLAELERLGPAEGVDASPEAVEFCRRRGLEHVREARLESLPFEDGRFDLVLTCDVLEHVDDDVAALRELHRVAAPEGKLLVTVPAYQLLWSAHDDSHHHYRRYTKREIVARVEEAGWEPLVVTYFNTLLLPPIAAVRAGQRLRTARNGRSRSDYELTPPSLNAVLELPMRGEAALIGRGARFPAGLSVGLVCRAVELTPAALPAGRA